VTLGLNIHTPAVQLDFLLDLIQEFSLSPCLRLGLAHPCLDGTNHFLHPRHYPEVGRRVAAFAGRAHQSGVNLEFDCGFVPCMFPPGSWEAGGEAAADLGRRCNPILDVLPDGQVLPCYPLASLCRVPLPNDHDAAWLRAWFEERTRPYRPLGLFRECAVCPLREAGDCVGGCLAAALQRLRHSPFVVTVAEGREGEERGKKGRKGTGKATGQLGNWATEQSAPAS
jgi:cyclic pyranopterin phosphate synthase